jgi:hypothetical protein
MVRLAAMLLAGLLSAAALAHKASDGYLTLAHRGASLDVRLDLALRDLENAIGLDADGDGAITWGELRAKHADIAAYAASRLSVSSGGEACALSPVAHEVDRHTDGAYTVLRLSGRCASDAPTVAIDYRMLFDVDPTHRGLVRYVVADGSTRTTVLTAEAPSASLSVHTSAMEQAIAYFLQGIHHIWEGIDHLLFLLSLLLPAVLVWRNGGWTAVGTFRAAIVDAAWIVTAFTIAHSITLTLAVLGIVTLPSRLVESAIALSVVLAAMNNLWPVVRHGRALAAFGFGLIHGFGFASALGELGLPDEALALSLASFNIGVEAGQLAVVAVFLPLAFALRGTTAYRDVALRGGSVAIALVALVWFVERAFDSPRMLASVLPG